MPWSLACEVDLVVLDRPALPARDRLPDPEQVVLHPEIFLGRHLRQPDAEVLLELGFEREVRLDIVPGPPELEALPHAGPGELNGDQDQRCSFFSEAVSRDSVLGDSSYHRIMLRPFSRTRTTKSPRRWRSGWTRASTRRRSAPKT